jgi:8-oxo-dGTP diphosphatase
VSASTEREVVDVAVGVLIRDDGAFLLTTRPAGKVYAGYWEFPGGKIEAGETVEAALVRELQEELGITASSAPQHLQRWKEEIMDYEHARVRLFFCRVFAWSGAFEMREGQSMSWQQLPVQVQPVLPGTIPVLEWFAEERGHLGARFIA